MTTTKSQKFMGKREYHVDQEKNYSPREVYEGIRQVLADTLGMETEDINLESTLARDLGAESIDYLDIIFRLEKKFAMKIPKSELFPELNDDKYFDNNKISDAGVDYINKNHPHLTVDEDRRLGLSEHFNVQSVVNYVESKLGERLK